MKQTPTNFLVHHGTLITVYKAKLADAAPRKWLVRFGPSRGLDKKFVVDIRKAVDDGRSVVTTWLPTFIEWPSAIIPNQACGR
ncbi:MAG: hypothetical protein R3C09_18790 [Pirellulaceae bacterium]